MLVQVSDVLDSMGLASRLEASMTPGVTHAIAKAQLRMETILGTRLSKLTCTDYFQLDSDRFNGITPGNMMAMRLKNSFLTEPPIITTCTSWNGTFLDPSIADSTFSALSDLPLGIIKVDKQYDESFIKVAYTSGFDGSEESQELADIQEALLSIIPMILQASKSTNDDTVTTTASSALTEEVAAQYQRTIGFCYRPVHSEAAPV